MNRRRSHVSNNQVRSLCGQLGSDDGVNPAEFFRPSRRANENRRKLHQLCHQVADTLNLVLSGEYGQELQHVRVVAVTPAPDASQLLVLVGPAIAGDRLDARRVLSQLNEVAGELRSEVAAAITRRRAPKLLFQLLDPAAEVHR